jgi:ribosomal protein L29
MFNGRFEAETRQLTLKHSVRTAKKTLRLSYKD